MLDFINSLSLKTFMFGCLGMGTIGASALVCMTTFVLVSAMNQV